MHLLYSGDPGTIRDIKVVVAPQALEPEMAQKVPLSYMRIVL